MRFAPFSLPLALLFLSCSGLGVVACVGASDSAADELASPTDATEPPGADGAVSTTDGATPGDAASPSEDASTSDDASTPPIGGGRGDSCATATRIFASSVSLKGQTTVGYERKYAGCSRMRGRDRAYAVQVPPGRRVRARVVSTQAGYAPEIHAVAGPETECNANPLECVANSKAGTWLMWVNKDPVAREVFLIVDSDDVGDPGGSFDLDVTLEEPPAGETCRNAPVVAIAPGGTVSFSDSTELYMKDYSSTAGCDLYGSGPDRVYAVDVPSGQRLTGTLTGAPGTSVSLNFMAAQVGQCDAKVECFTGDAPYSAATVTLSNSNRSGATRRVLVVVKASGPYEQSYPGKPFVLDLALAAVSTVAGEACENAVPLTAGVALEGESSVGFQDDFGPVGYAGGCTGAGGDKVYQVAVGAGQELSVVVTPVAGSTFDPAIDVTVGSASACGAAPRACVEYEDVKGVGAAETLKWKNDGAATQTAFVVVSDSSSSRTGATRGGGQYSILATLTP